MQARWSRLSRWPGDCPITWALIAANAVTFLAAFVAGAPVDRLAFFPPEFLDRPWTVLTYPLAGSGNILWFVIGGYVLWLFGGSLERAWRWRDYTIFLVATAVVPAISVWLGGALTGRVMVLTGLWLPLAAATVAWAAINPHERVLLYFIIPLEARWLAAVVVALVVFFARFPLGVFAAAGCGVAWWYARTGRDRLWNVTFRRSPPRTRVRHEDERFSLNPAVLLRRWRTRRRFLRVVRDSEFKKLH